MDDTAREIARLREEAKAPKSPKPARLPEDGSRSLTGYARNSIPLQRPGGVAPAPSTKRPKTFGS